MKFLGATQDSAVAPSVSATPVLAGVGYWVLKADSSTTFPARSSIPAWWTGSVVYDSTVYLNHADPTDRVTGDQHLKRTA
jgi:hypothetical protein